MRRLSHASLLAAALLCVAAPSGRAADEKAATASPAVERHSPREGYPSLGPAGAGNTLIFFTDYQCPVCPRAARELETLVRNLEGLVRVEVRHNPLEMHKQAAQAAAAATAAQRQGRFWEFHDRLIASHRLEREALLQLAQELGLDMDAFVKDLDNQALRDLVAAQAKQARDAGASATPGFLINGHAMEGWASLPYLEQVVRAHLK